MSHDIGGSSVWPVMEFEAGIVLSVMLPLVDPKMPLLALSQLQCCWMALVKSIMRRMLMISICWLKYADPWVLRSDERPMECAEIDPRFVTNGEAIDERSRNSRGSYYLLGAMLGRFNYASIYMPGGCNFGPRQIDLHVKGFEALGATTVSKAWPYYGFFGKNAR